MAEAAAPPDQAISERDLQAQVVELARLLGWLVFHPYDARRSQAGFPDLTLVRPPRVVLAELKSARGRLRADQRRWGEALGACPGIAYELWRPADWDRICEVLR